MKLIDLLEPLPIVPAGDSLGTAVHLLRSGMPVAVEQSNGTWHVVRPSDAVGLPDSRQFRDLPSHPLPTLAIDQEIRPSEVLACPVWGATKGDELIGRVDRARVIEALRDEQSSELDDAINAQLRDRLVPKVLHDLSNVLTVLGVQARGHAGVEHAGSLLDHLRSLFGDSRALKVASGQTSSNRQILLSVLFERLKTVLITAARPASLTFNVSQDIPALQGPSWRLEAVLINLVLNASEVASEIQVTGFAREREAVLLVEDNGPGFPPPDTLEVSPGLGLSSVYRQVALLGGHMTLETSALGGARVHLCFPT